MLMPHPTIAAVSYRRQSNFELALVLRNSNKNRSYNNSKNKLKLTMKPVARQHQFMISTNKLELLNIFMSRDSIWIPLWSSHNPVTVTAPVATWSQGENGEKMTLQHWLRIPTYMCSRLELDSVATWTSKTISDDRLNVIQYIILKLWAHNFNGFLKCCVTNEPSKQKNVQANFRYGKLQNILNEK